MKLTTQIRLLTAATWFIIALRWALFAFGVWQLAVWHWWPALIAWLLYCGVLEADALTPLGLLNFCVLQWFGMRVRRHEQRLTVANADLALFVGERIMSSGTNGPRVMWRVAAVDGDQTRLQRYSAARWIWPLTGWWTDYRYIARRP